MAATYRQHRFRRPPGATELIVVRHGESEPAVEGVPFPMVDGHGDPALAPDGEQQATFVGDRLADEAIDAIYVSTLRRTAQTAAPLVARTGLAPVVEADLREVHLGEWEGGLFRQKAAAGDPAIVRMAETQRWDEIPGAESTEAFGARVRAAVERIAAAHPDQRVAVFTHGGVIGELVSQAFGGGLGIRLAGADNGSITHLVVGAGPRWVLRRFNDTAHLPGGLDRPEDLPPHADPTSAAFSA
jgi:probable phosphoglycerate mutase